MHLRSAHLATGLEKPPPNDIDRQSSETIDSHLLLFTLTPTFCSLSLSLFLFLSFSLFFLRTLERVSSFFELLVVIKLDLDFSFFTLVLFWRPWRRLGEFWNLSFFFFLNPKFSLTIICLTSCKNDIENETLCQMCIWLRQPYWGKWEKKAHNSRPV